VICALVNLEALRAPLELRFFDRIPPIYDRLAEERGAVIVECHSMRRPRFLETRCTC